MKLALKYIAFLFVSTIWAQEPIGQTQKVTNSALKCVSGDCVNGWGKWDFENGYYDGFFVNGKKEGYGLYKWNDFGTYIGFWFNDKMEGYGSYEDENSVIKSGMYINGALNGLGEESTTEKEYKRGIYSNHSLTTSYDFISNNVDKGCTAGDCKDIYGRYVWDNGDIFTGFFKNSVPFLGIYDFSNGNYYNGMFNSKGQFHGQGRFFYKNGGYYGGEFINGNFSGKGYYHDKDYVTKIGIWETGKLIKYL